jgi:hypothetical protein
MAGADNNKNPEQKSDAPEGTFRDRPRPIDTYRDEAAKTAAALDQSTKERAAADNRVDALNKSYTPALEQHQKELKVAGDERIASRKAAVDGFAAEVTSAEQNVAELRKKLSEESERLGRSRNSLSTAAHEMNTEGDRIAKDNKASMRKMKKELNGAISTAKRERKGVYRKTGKMIRRERWNTFKNTTREAVAFFPDLAVRFGKAAKRGVVEVADVFHKSAHKAKKGFQEPTPFSITRENQPEQPSAPKAAPPAPPKA